MVRINLGDALQALVEMGRAFLDRPVDAGDEIETLVRQCGELVSLRGEASGTALASEIAEGYRALSVDFRLQFMERIAQEFGPDLDRIAQAAEGFLELPGTKGYRELALAMEAPRQQLFQRLNMAPGGTAMIIGMRQLILTRQHHREGLEGLEHDLRQLLASWFNRGFLQFEQIDWRTPAMILEKLIIYEAVHEISGWDDLRRRLESDRRCFAFFHPALPDEPLIIVQVALTKGLAVRIQDVIEAPPGQSTKDKPDSAIFYSISNCQEGLVGISFGNLLIKQVVDAIRKELPEIRKFATLSPVPGFCAWLYDSVKQGSLSSVSEAEMARLTDPEFLQDGRKREQLRPTLTRLCATYLLTARRGQAPLDPVGRFHLGNGASIEQIDWNADPSPKGIAQSLGMMVNYLYDPEDIVSNHESFVREGRIATSTAVSGLLDG